MVAPLRTHKQKVAHKRKRKHVTCKYTMHMKTVNCYLDKTTLKWAKEWETNESFNNPNERQKNGFSFVICV